MNIDSVKEVTVIGSGTMGNGIAQVLATGGYSVNLIDVHQEFVDKAVGAIDKSLDRLVKKQALSASQKEQILGRITTGIDLGVAGDSQLVIEAISEDLQSKLGLFGRLRAICTAETIVGSNTSSLPITQLAAATGRPENFIGMHFMNPVPVMKLIELIRGMATSNETFATIHDLAIRLGKTPVEVNDYPGFVANRILMPMINEACFALMEGVATAESIDEVMKLGMAHPMGPLTLADFIGLDVCLAILEVMQEGLGDPKYRPCPLLRKMVLAGYLGRKSGRGFYIYD